MKTSQLRFGKGCPLVPRGYGHLDVLQRTLRKRSSCDSGLSDRAGEIEKSILQHQYAVGMLLDILEADDNLEIEASIEGLTNRGIPEQICQVTSWKITAELRHLTKDTAQGGIPLTLGCNFSFKDLPDRLGQGAP